MMATDATSHLDDAFREVRAMVARGTPFEYVETYIDANVQLDEAERAVLWLFAWCSGETGELRKIITEEVSATG
jgi:hypothetical protein